MRLFLAVATVIHTRRISTARNSVLVNIAQTREGKASALIALDDMYANYGKRVEQQKQQSEDVVLEQKILALQSYDGCASGS